MNIKDLIQKYQDEILDLHKKGHKKSEITKILITNHSLSIAGEKVDSLRRRISSFIDKSELINNTYDFDSVKVDINTQLSEDEVYLSSKSTDELLEEFSIDNDDDTDSDEPFDEEEFKKTLKSAYEHNDKFWYISEQDSYYFNIPGYPNGMKFNGTLIRELKNMYSYLGKAGGITINQICRAVKLPRDIIITIKTYMGWTHDTDPFTNEEMLTGDIDEMVDRTLEDRKFTWFQKYTRKEQKAIAEAANKWWQFKGNIINPFIEKYNEDQLEYKAKPIPRIQNPTGDPYGLVMGPFDLHFGKYAWSGDTGNTYNRQIAAENLIKSTKSILSDLKYSNIDKIFIPVGSDFYHCDTIGGTTTRGTPQDLDGTTVQIMVEGNRLMIEFIDILRQVADVELILAAGNHDYILSHQLLEVLGAHYRNTPGVVVTKCYQFRQYTMYGNTLIGFTHGDETKLTELPGLMSKEAKHLWAEAEHHAVFTGHLHHEMVKDINGVKIYQMPSLAGTDRWHHKKGYTMSVKGLAAYLIHKTKGVRQTLVDNI